MKSPFKHTILCGHVALVTGGGSGIGLEIATQLGLHGAKIMIMGRRESVLLQACSDLRTKGIDIHSFKGDVRIYTDCESAVQKVIEQYGSLDIVVNGAAGNFLATADQLTSKGFKTVMDIDALGTFNISRAAYPALKKSKHPAIVNISATLHYGATWYQIHAAAAKAAVDSMTRTLALEWGGDGIRVNGIAPGPIQGTAGLTKLAPGSNATMAQMFQERIPLGHPGKPWDIAMAAIYLVSHASSFVNGHVMVVDGGEWMWRPPLLPRESVFAASRNVEAQSRQIGTSKL